MILSVKVIPNSSVDRVVGWLGDQLKVKVRAQPEKGSANAAVIDLLGQVLGLNRASLSIHSGHTKANKLLQLSDITRDELLTALKKVAGEDKIPPVYTRR